MSDDSNPRQTHRRPNLGRLSLGTITALVLLGCGGDEDENSLSCEDVCFQLVECGATETTTDCTNGCRKVENMLAPRYFQQVALCSVEGVCSPDILQDCLLDTASQASADVVKEYLFRPICERSIECLAGAGSATQSAVDRCLQGVDPLPEQALVLALLRESVLSCVATCFGQVTCDELMSENPDWASGCMEQCLDL